MIVLFLLLSLTLTIDYYEGITRKFKLDKHYDLGQSLIIFYTKNGFYKSYNFFNLFIFMVKVKIFLKS
jgi:hypothetical protein